MRTGGSCEFAVAARRSSFSRTPASPSSRGHCGSVLEHVVALKWLAAEGNRVVDPMIRELANQADRRRQAMEAASWTGGNHSAFAEAIADGAAATDDVSQDTYLKFKHRCDTYGHPDEGSSWLIETAHSHPGWETAAPYLKDDKPPQLLLVPEERDRDNPGWCAMKLWEALHALSSMQREAQWPSWLRHAHA